MGLLRHNAMLLSLPTGWVDGTQVVALGEADGDFRPNVVLSRDSCNEPIEKFAAKQVALARQALPGLTVVKEARATFGANSGHLREQTFSNQGKQMTQLVFYMQQGARVYTMTFTHLAQRVAQHRKVAEGLFAGLKIGR